MDANEFKNLNSGGVVCGDKVALTGFPALCGYVEDINGDMIEFDTSEATGYARKDAEVNVAYWNINIIEKRGLAKIAREMGLTAGGDKSVLEKLKEPLGLLQSHIDEIRSITERCQKVIDRIRSFGDI